MMEEFKAIREESARKDVYGRRIGCQSTTGRLLYKPPPNFTIQQFRKYKRKQTEKKLVEDAGLSRSIPSKQSDKSILLMSENIRAFNHLIDRETPFMKTKRKKRPAYAKPDRSHTQDCKELRTVIQKFREDYYYKPTGEKIKGVHFPEATAWFKGQWVECLHKKRWHPGQIANFHFDVQGRLTFEIRYPWLGSLGNDTYVPEHHLRWMPPKRHWYKGEPVVVNWLGRGNWYTASVAHVHNDGSNSVDILFDDGRTVGCVNGPRYLSRVDNSLIQQVKWYKGQPVLAQYRGRGLWYRAHIIEVEQKPKVRGKMSPVFKGLDDDNKKDEGEEDEQCKVTVLYDGLGGGKATESGVSRKLLRPWLGNFTQEISLPVSESENYGSSIESIFVPSTSIPNSVDLAWFWGSRSDIKMADDQMSSHQYNLSQSHTKIVDYCSKAHNTLKALKAQKRLYGGPDDIVPELRAPILNPTLDQYSLDGHIRKKKADTSDQRRFRSAKQKRAKQQFLDSKLNVAIHAAASPDQLVKLKRKGPGLEHATIRMKHKDLGGAGLILQKFVNSIEGVGYRKGKPIIKFYVTVKPGSYDELSNELKSVSRGTATVSLSTEIEKKVHFSGSTTGNTAAAAQQLLIDGAASPSNDAIDEVEKLVDGITHLEKISFLNWCKKGELKKIERFLKKYQQIVRSKVVNIDLVFTNFKTKMNPLLSATLGSQYAVSKFLLKNGFDPTVTDNSGRSAIKLARQNLMESENQMAGEIVSNENVLLWKKFVGLLANNVSVYQAAINGDVNRLRHLESLQSLRAQKSGKWLTKANDYGITPLHLAVMHGKIEVVRWLDRRLNAKAWRVMNRVGQTPSDLCVSAPPRWRDEITRISERSQKK